MPENVMAIVMQVAPLLLLLVVFYFMLIRPQQKQAKQTREMLANIKVGDRVKTAGGIYGVLTRVKDNTVTVQVGPDKVQLVFERSAIKSVEPAKKPNKRLEAAAAQDEAEEES